MEVQAHGLAEQVKVTARDAGASPAPSARPSRAPTTRTIWKPATRAPTRRCSASRPASPSSDPEPLEVLDRGVLREVGGGDGAGCSPRCPRPARTPWRWPSGATSRSTSAGSTCRATSCPTATRWRATSRSWPARVCARRYGASPGDAIEARLAHELAVIEKMGFAGYFLVVWDFIHYARAAGIAVGPGRGSSAGSLVAYCLGITNVDPIRYGLLFERFLNPERISMPDMDIDFADDRRDEVIRYVADKYGRDRVAHIITFGTLGAKAAIRDVGRVLGMTYADVDRIAKLVPGFPLNITLDDAYQKSPPLAETVKSQPAVQELWDIARALEGCTRHASVHASAVVISDEPLDEHIPLYKDPKRPELITGYAMGPIEKLGLLKMDFLGLRTLTVLANTVDADQGVAGYRPSTSTRCRSTTPRPTRSSARRKTFGVFQLESSGMREALRGPQARAARRRHRHGVAVPSGPDGADPGLHQRGSTGGPRSRTSIPPWRRSRGRRTGSWCTRSRSCRSPPRWRGFTHGRGGHPPAGHGQEGPRPDGAAAREVHRGLQGARHRDGQGRARVGADGEVRRLRLQQVPGRRYLGRDGRRLAQADHRGARGRRGAHQGRPARGAARAAQRHAAGRPPGPGQRHGAAVHTRSSDLHPARVGERAEARPGRRGGGARHGGGRGSAGGGPPAVGGARRQHGAGRGADHLDDAA